MCKLRNFQQKYKVENKQFEHFYRCVDKKTNELITAKIISKKNLSVESKNTFVREIFIIRKNCFKIFPKLKKIYEDDTHYYLVFNFL